MGNAIYKMSPADLIIQGSNARPFPQLPAPSPPYVNTYWIIYNYNDAYWHLIYSNIPLFAYDYNSQYIRLGFPWYDQMYAQMAAYGQTHFYLESDTSHDLNGRWNYPYGGTSWSYDQPISYNRDKNEIREIYSNYQLKTTSGGNVKFSYEGVNSVKNRVRNLKGLNSSQWEKCNGVYVIGGNRVNL